MTPRGEPKGRSRWPLAIATAAMLWGGLSSQAGCTSDEASPAAQGGSGGQGAGAGGSSPGQGGGGQGGGTSGAAGKAGGDPCEGKPCDDSIPCTLDTCQAGECVHKVDATACPKGQFCTVEKGCVGAPACANDQQCVEAWKSDPCKANPRCDAASAVCVFDPLDKDEDGHSPIVCGGDDCDDADAGRYPGKIEKCDQLDDNCDGDLDADASCAGFTESPALDAAHACVSGTCQCKSEFLCGNDCAPDKDKNPKHCGACFKACVPGESCKDSKCVCEKDVQNDVLHCGACFHACEPGELCSAGQCVCSADLQSQCGSAAWTTPQLNLCPLGYEKPSKLDALFSGSVDASGNPQPCPEDGKAAAPAHWFPQSLSYGCTGKIKLCASTKAGAFKATTPQDCVIEAVCVNVDYPKAGTTVDLPPMPGWKVDMAAASPAVKACTLQALNESGYVEFTLEGPCAGAKRWVRRVGFCFSGAPECSGAVNAEDSADLCQNIQDDDGDGTLDCADPDCCKLVDCKTFDPASFCAQQN